MEESQIYAIGQQDFSVLREDGAPYVDKTAFSSKTRCIEGWEIE